MNLYYLTADRGIPPDGTKGASIHFRALVRALAAGGARVTAFTARRPDGGALDSIGGAPWFRLRSTRTLLDAADRVGVPDAICERYSLTGGAGYEASREFGCPFVLEVNAPLFEEASRHRSDTVGPGDRERERELFQAADLVVTVSEPLREYVARVRGTKEGTRVIRNGADASRYSDVGEGPRGGDARPFVAFLGHPKPWHGSETLAVLLDRLKRSGSEARLLIIGGGPGADRVRAACRERGVEDRLEITGPVPEPEAARRLVEATLTVAPYPEIPFFYFCPLKIIESMMAGVPVVATSQGDVPEILKDGGLLVPPGDDDAFFVAVRRVLDEPDLGRRLGANGQARARTQLTWDRAARELVQAVQLLTSPRENVR